MNRSKVGELLIKLVFKTTLIFCNESTRAKAYTRFLDVKMGKNVIITGRIFFGSEPYLVTIGDNVRLTHGVTFHTHDGGVGILRSKYPGINIIKPIKVGDNVFIGSHVTIMPGVTIGNNVIIGATSVVTRDIPDNVIYAGIPAKFIKTLKEYEEKVLEEAVFLSTESSSLNRKEEILNALNKK
ncbi:MAG: acyltransferase [Mucilaginibacter sp.]